MKRAISTALFLSTATAGQAQDLLQADSVWLRDAAAVLEARVAATPLTGTAKNVILIVGDGNDVAATYATRLYMGQKAGGFGDEFVLPQDTFANVALIKTYLPNAQTPDSAPTATALNTGVKTDDGVIGLDEDANLEDCATFAGNELTSLAEIATAAGKSVGNVTTTRITHATPAAVYARTVARDWESSVPEGCTAQKDIAQQLVEAMDKGIIDVAMGGGRREFLPSNMQGEEGDGGNRKDGLNLIAAGMDKGWAYAWNKETAAALPLDGSKPILALFEGSHMQYEADRTDEPSLAEMTEAAIKALSTNQNGFFLQIEGGRIDHALHDGNLARAVADGEAMAKAIQMADDMTNDEDTLIIVTADHGHNLAFNGYCGRGSSILGLCMEIDPNGVAAKDTPNLAADGKPYTVAGFVNGPGAIVTELADGSWVGNRPTVTEEEAESLDYLQQSSVPTDSETHSGVDIQAYAKGPWAHLVGGVVEQNYLFNVMTYAMSAK
ncbi:alkaline phosphatase [Paracoccus spongiarum]|uniref:Alkaline phosphatase n=1 Tax=Paracoccus spongiarum TaxID=3064387 RepID=A0ABT9JJK0_9RHOB|nr:alkaline phosphatase [Paracoccus sp. 2205BS29-5]MDP5309241.1 alkaline phosphatase [Paracoccus sp. 2205BS29-5]